MMDPSCPWSDFVRPELPMITCLRVATVAALAVGALPAWADATGDEGCTPGYWKNHTWDWLENEEGDPSYDPSERFSDVFEVDHGAVTLLEALQGGGGSGIAGAQAILARAATAAILNAAHEGVGYPLRRWKDTDAGGGIFTSVQAVWDCGDRDEILELAELLDELNNLGCPLGGPAPELSAPARAPASIERAPQPTTRTELPPRQG